MYKQEIGKGEFIADENKYMIRDMTVDSLVANGRKINDLSEYTDWKGLKDDGLTESFQRGGV